MSEEWVLVRVPRRWVPRWLWWLCRGWMPLAMLLTEHVADECGCPCHETPGMRDCAFCG